VLLAAGAALTCFYMVTELLSWKATRASEIKASLVVRDLYRKLHARTKPLLDLAIRQKHTAGN
jgi:hypothetical protein